MSIESENLRAQLLVYQHTNVIVISEVEPAYLKCVNV